MDVMEAIKQRRSVGKVKPEPVDRELIETILEAAIWAPNHRMTEPWRFFVMTGDGRRQLGRAYADVAEAGQPGISEEQRDELRKAQENKALRAPVVIAVAATPSDDPHAPLIEELAAVHSAVQNMLLAAHALGLGAIWRTGDPTYHPLMKQAFGLAEEDHMVGFIYIGYPDMAPHKSRRKPIADKTVWIDR